MRTSNWFAVSRLNTSANECCNWCAVCAAGCFIYGGPLVPGACDPPLRADAPVPNPVILNALTL